MKTLFSDKRNNELVSKVPIVLNSIFLGLGVFILLAMSIVLGIFEEFTAFTDYTQDWIEFNFFILYWDKLVFTRVYLSLLFVYGAFVVLISAFQIHAIRKRNFDLLFILPYVLLGFAIVTILGGLCWLIVTSVNHNEGFLSTGGFIFERMRFKGNVWKDLKYREESFKLVAYNQVPAKADVLSRWVHQRERDFECCGWESYKDYIQGGFKVLPESCCKRKYRVFECGANYQTEDKSNVLNTRGCKSVMYDWYRRGFIANIVMALVGIGIAAYEFVLYTMNRKEYFKAIDDIKNKNTSKIEKMFTQYSRSNSKGSINALNDVQKGSRVNLQETKNLLSNESKPYDYETEKDKSFNDDYPKPLQITNDRIKHFNNEQPRAPIITNNRFDKVKLYREDRMNSTEDEDSSFT